jgi:hypothetical protein
MHENQREAREKTEIIELMALLGNRMAVLSQTLANTLEKVLEKHPGHKICPILVFNIFENNKNFNFMAVVKTLTLTSTAPVTLNMTVTDGDGGPEIAGVLSGLTYAPADPTQDIAVVDPTVATEVDVHVVSNTGGTTVTGTGTFVSTLLGPDGKTPAFSGPVTGTLVLVNNIPVKVLAPVLAFNQ